MARSLSEKQGSLEEEFEFYVITISAQNTTLFSYIRTAIVFKLMYKM
jgi:hypothetical protein